MLVTLISSMGPFKTTNKQKLKMAAIYGFACMQKVHVRSQILECPCFRENFNISGVPVLPGNMIIMFFRKC